MLIAYIPFFIAIVGLLLWALAGNALVKEVGKILFFCGALVTTFSLADRTVRVGSAPSSR